jgi:ABC-type multidrug transport system permease subunit
MMLVAIVVIKVAFGVPFHGGLLLILAGGALCILSGISLGTVIATFSKSAQQAQLTSFFVNPPLASLSGALNPVEAMPRWLQPLTVLNPIHPFRHDRAREYAQRKRTCDALAQFHSSLYVHARFVLIEHLAFPKAIHLRTAFRSYCDI